MPSTPGDSTATPPSAARAVAGGCGQEAGRPPASRQQSTSNVITPFQALCLAERCALLSGRDIDFVMNVFAAWTGVRWGELHGGGGMGRRRLAPADRQGRHLDVRRRLAAARTWRRRPQGAAEGRLLPRARPAAVPRRAHAMGHGQPAHHLPLPASRWPRPPARETTSPSPTTCSWARAAVTLAARTTPTAT